MMKKIKLHLFALCATLVLVSCGGSDNDPVFNNTSAKEVKVISAQGIILSKSKSGAILKMTVYQDGKEIYQNTVSVPDSENNTKSIQYTNIKN